MRAVILLIVGAGIGLAAHYVWRSPPGDGRAPVIFGDNFSARSLDDHRANTSHPLRVQTTHISDSLNRVLTSHDTEELDMVVQVAEARVLPSMVKPGDLVNIVEKGQAPSDTPQLIARGAPVMAVGLWELTIRTTPEHARQAVAAAAHGKLRVELFQR